MGGEGRARLWQPIPNIAIEEHIANRAHASSYIHGFKLMATRIGGGIEYVHLIVNHAIDFQTFLRICFISYFTCI